MDERVASILDEAFPGREVDGLGSTGPSWNEKNRTVRVDFADGQSIYLKMASDGDGTRIARERAILAYVGANSEVPVPTVLASDTDGVLASDASSRIPYLATAPVSGTNLLELWYDDETERTALARQVGQSLASVHELRFEDHGHVVGGSEADLELETGPWTDVLVDKIEETRDLATSDRFEHHFDEVVAAVEANRELLDDAPAALLHGDPAHPNCFRTESGLGFLDWEIAHVGDPARDVVRTREQQLTPLRDDGPEEIVTAFYDGYRERAGGLPAGFEKRSPIYEAVRFLGASGFFDKWVDFVDEPPEELANWIGEEMERRLAEISA